MKFISEVNDDFLEKHNKGQWNAVLAGYGSFDISLSQWYNYTETNGIFKKIAIERLKGNYIDGSWNSYNGKLEELRKSDPKKLKDEVKQLAIDLADLTSRISQRDYFAPIQTEVLSFLERIHSHSLELAGVKSDKETPGKDDKRAVLIWQGGVSTLCTLFCDLKALQLKNGKVYLSASNQQLVDFILNNFVDESGQKFERSSVLSYIYKEEKYARTNRVDISHLKDK